MQRSAIITILVSVLQSCGPGGDKEMKEDTLVTNTKTEKTTPAPNACEAEYQAMLTRYEQDYNSCLVNIGPAEPPCQRPDGLDEYSKENLNVLILLDASGSMKAKLGSEEKMAVAKKAVHLFLNNMPEKSNVGLIVYGHKGTNQPSGKAVSCAGVDVVYPLSPWDKGKFSQVVNSFQPTGFTPIAGAIQRAKETLSGYDSSTHTNLIYIVSDGIETCDGNPVDAARELHQTNIKAIVNIIGFDTDDKASEQLQQVAEAGGGTYIDANSAKELYDIVGRQTAAIKEIHAYLLCLMKHRNRMVLEYTSKLNNSMRCITSKRNLENMKMTSYLNTSFRKANPGCVQYVEDRKKERSERISHWQDSIRNAIKEKRSLDMKRINEEAKGLFDD